jgi:hypothetical protein
MAASYRFACFHECGRAPVCPEHDRYCDWNGVRDKREHEKNHGHEKRCYPLKPGVKPRELLKNLMRIIQALERKGAGLRALNLGMDTNTPTGKLMLTVLRALLSSSGK